MKDYFQLNKKKIKFQVVSTYIAFGVLLLGACFFTNQVPQSFDDVVLFLLGWTGLTIMVSIIIHAQECLYFIRRKKLYARKNWADFFEKHNFHKALFNEDSKFLMTEEGMRGKIQDFKVVTWQEKNWVSYMSFEFYSEYLEQEDKNKTWK